MRIRGVLATLFLTTTAFAPSGAGAQGAQSPDLVDFALLWSRGSYRSPLVCTFADGSHRGLRRVSITAGRRQATNRSNRVTFTDLEAGEASRCTSALGGEQLNVVGTLELRYRATRPHSDTPERDFKEELERGYLDYEIASGVLRMGPVTASRGELEPVDFRGGTARLDAVKPGSDAARLLAEFGPLRKLELSLAAPDGTRLEMPLVEFERR